MSEHKDRPTFEFHFHDKVGQNIANVEHMEVRFDKDMQMQVMNVEEMKESSLALQKQAPQDGVTGSDAIPVDEDLFHFIHPEVDDAEAVKVHQQVKRLVSRFGIQQICDYLSQMASERKILLPPGVKTAYDELVRMGMPEGEGFAYKTFEKYYKK